MSTASADNYAGAPGEAAKGTAGGFDPARVLRIVQQHSKLVLVATLICGAGAVAAGKLLGTPKYRSQGTLVYQKLPLPPEQVPFVPVAKFDTLAGLITSPGNMEELARACNLAIDPLILKNFFKVEEPLGGIEKATIQLDWPNPEDGAALVNRLMDIHIERTAEARKQLVEASYQKTKKQLEEIEKQWTAALEDYDRKKAKANTLDPKLEMDQITKNISDREADLVAANKQLSGVRAKKQEIQKQIDEIAQKLKDKQPVKIEVDEGYKKLMEELTLQLKVAQGSQRELRVLLGTAHARYDEEKRAIKGGFGKPEELKKIGAEIDGLKEKLKTADEVVQALQKRIDEENKDPSAPFTKTMRQDLRKLEQDEIGLAGEIAAGQERLRLLKEHAKERAEAFKPLEEPRRLLETIETNRKHLALQEAALANARGADFRELAKESHAKPSYNSIGSDAKKIMAIAFVGPITLFLAALVGLNMRSATWKAETLAAKLQMPILARCTGRAGSGRLWDAEEARSLALRVRQYVSDKGGMILFTSLNKGKDVDDLVGDLSHYLSMRDERVLILDARIAQPELPALVKLVERPVEVLASNGEAALSDADPCLSGLVQYLVFDDQNPADFIHPTTTRGVFFMPAGGPYHTTDALASEPMKELLARLRKQYSVILVIGPSVAHTTDNEILAAYVNGIIILLNGSTSSLATAEPFLQSLKEVNAPLIGSVLFT